MILGFAHSVQFSVLMKAIGAGYALGLLYCIFMLFNSIWNKHTLSVLFRDISFFAIAAVMTFLFALKYNSGIIRFYILAGELIGFCVFYIFPGSATGKIFRIIGNRLKTVFGRITEYFTSNIKKIKDKLKIRKEKTAVKRKKEENAAAKSKKQQKILCFKQKIQKKFVKPLDIKK